MGGQVGAPFKFQGYFVPSQKVEVSRYPVNTQFTIRAEWPGSGSVIHGGQMGRQKEFHLPQAHRGDALSICSYQEYAVRILSDKGYGRANPPNE